MEFGLKNILQSRNETMKHVSEETGISQNTLSMLNLGKSGGIKFDTLERLCNYLNCTPNDLLKLQNNKYFVTALSGALVNKDNFFICPFSIYPNKSLEFNEKKAFFITGGYWIDQYNHCSGKLLNITAGVMKSIEFENMYNSVDYHSKEETEEFLNNMSEERKKTLASRIATGLLGSVPLNSLPKYVVVSITFKAEREIFKSSTFQQKVSVGIHRGNENLQITIGDFSTEFHGEA